MPAITSLRWCRCRIAAGESYMVAKTRQKGCARFLSALAGCHHAFLKLATKDDGSGLQRWVRGAVVMRLPPPPSPPSPSPSASSFQNQWAQNTKIGNRWHFFFYVIFCVIMLPMRLLFITTM
jgi:hypothetical protein